MKDRLTPSFDPTREYKRRRGNVVMIQHGRTANKEVGIDLCPGAMVSRESRLVIDSGRVHH